MCGRRMFVGKFTVLLRRSCMMHCVLMLAHICQSALLAISRSKAI
jgi:hypothetical protein